ncbi:GIT Spa2 (SHD) domain [Trinorchestia longiramus]|nr:GIT Spa2 (SHD) domain [Trinorchestia longiramus]
MARNIGPPKNHIKHPHEIRQVCADCSANGAEWASINRGVLVCTDCCSVHRSLGRHVSQIKYIHDKDWHPHTWNLVSSLSSGGANGVWEHTLLDPTNSKNNKKKPLPSDPVHPVKADFVRAKHQMLSYVLHPPSPSPPHPATCLPPVLGEEEPRDGGASVGPDDEEEEALSQELHSSVRTANLETSLRLLAQGADPNYFHKGRGNCPLHVAASSGQAEQVELLLVYGATPLCQDSALVSPAQAARNGGYSDIAARLMDVELELVTRLLCYLSDQQTNCPPHSQPYRNAGTFGSDTTDAVRGRHFALPRQLTSAHQHATDAARQAREKLIKLPLLLLEELAADLYDEVDRRELDQVWSRKRESVGSTGDRCDVPFLPVNPLLSSTRNQARQKLARLQEGELCSLIVDLLVEVERRTAILTPGRHGATTVPARTAAPASGDSDLQLPTKDIGQNSTTCKAEHPTSSTPFSCSVRPVPSDLPFPLTDRPLPSSPTDSPSFTSQSPDLPSPVSPPPPPSFFLHSGPRFHSSATLSADDTDSSRASADRSSLIAAPPSVCHQPPLFPSPSSPTGGASVPDVLPVFSLNFESATNLCLGPANTNPCSDDGKPERHGKFACEEACRAGERSHEKVLTCDDLVSEASSFVNMMSSRDKTKQSGDDGAKNLSPSCFRNDLVQSSREFQLKADIPVRESTISEDSLQLGSNNKTRLYLPLKSVTDDTYVDCEGTSYFSPHSVFGHNSQHDQPPSFFLRQRSGSEGIYPPLSPESTVDSVSCTYAPLGSVGSGINPPLSPMQSTLGYHLPARRVPSGINPPLSPQASNIDTASETYVQLGSIRSGINPPLSPQASTFDTASETYAQLGSVKSGINPPLSRENSTVDTISENYAQLGSISSGIHPSLSVPSSNLDSASEAYVNLGSIYSGIHPALTPAASSVGSRAPYDQHSGVPMAFGRNNQNNPLYQSYDTVHVSSDEASEAELAETKSLDEGRVADTEDNTEVNMTEDEKLSRKITLDEKTSKKLSGKKGNDSGKSVRRRIRESFQRVTNNNRSDDIKRSNRSDKYSSGFSSESNMSSEGESQYTVSSRSEVVKTPLSTRSSTGLFAAQISRSFRQKFMSKSKDGRKESNSVLKRSEAVEKSRSLPLSKTGSVGEAVGKRASAGPEDKVKNFESRSKFVRTLTMPLKLASQRRPSLSRGISRSQPTTPEMARKHRVVQSYTRQRTSTNIFGHNSYMSPQLRIRDPLNVSSPQPASSMRSLFSGKEKNTIKHISKPIMVTDPLNFQRLTTSTKSLMTHRDKNYMRPLVKSYGSDGKPPIASKPAPHHSSENLHRIRVSNSGDLSSSSFEPAAMASSCRTSELYADELFLEVCDKCRQNVSDGIQHPSIWGFNEYLPAGYVRSPEEIKTLVAAAARKKNAKDDSGADGDDDEPVYDTVCEDDDYSLIDAQLVGLVQPAEGPRPDDQQQEKIHLAPDWDAIFEIESLADEPLAASVAEQSSTGDATVSSSPAAVLVSCSLASSQQQVITSVSTHQGSQTSLASPVQKPTVSSQEYERLIKMMDQSQRTIQQLQSENHFMKSQLSQLTTKLQQLKQENDTLRVFGSPSPPATHSPSHASLYQSLPPISNGNNVFSCNSSESCSSGRCFSSLPNHQYEPTSPHHHHHSTNSQPRHIDTSSHHAIPAMSFPLPPSQYSTPPPSLPYSPSSSSHGPSSSPRTPFFNVLTSANNANKEWSRGRPFSMYDSRDQSRSANTHWRSSPHDAVENNNDWEAKTSLSSSAQQRGASSAHQRSASFSENSSRPNCDLPTQAEMSALSSSIAEGIHELLAVVQAGEADRQPEKYIACSEKICASVRDMASAFKKGRDGDNVPPVIHAALVSLVQTTVALNNLCSEGVYSHHIVDKAYAVAKATKGIVSYFQ